MERDQCLDLLDDLFMRIGRQLRQKIDADAYTIGQIATLRLLFRRGPTPMGELAEGLGVALAVATGIVDRLVQSKMVRRYRSDDDRRVVLVELGEAGRRDIERIQEARLQHIGALASRLSAEELTLLVGLLRKIADTGDGCNG